MTPIIEAAFGATLRRICNPSWTADFSTPKPVVGPEYDPLAGLPPQVRWSRLQHELVGKLRQIEPKYKLAVLTMMCNDAPYIAEFVAHHLAVGVERIFVYTNNNIDSSLAVLRWFEANGLVTVLPMVTAGGMHIQRKNYHHALFLLPELRLYDWVGVIDSDEYLLPDSRYNYHLPTMLDAAPVGRGGRLSFPGTGGWVL